VQIESGGKDRTTPEAERRESGTLAVEDISELHMCAQAADENRTADPVVSGIIDALNVRPYIQAFPDVGGVVAFEDGFATIGQAAVAKQKTQTAEREVLLVIALDSVRDKCHSGAIVFAIPAIAVETEAELDRLINFRIGVRLGLAIVPAETHVGAHPGIELLFEVESEPILTRDLQGMIRNIRRRRQTGEEVLVRNAIDSHVCAIVVSEHAHDSLSLGNESAMKDELDVFGAGFA
jgi:hypothetical protein